MKATPFSKEHYYPLSMASGRDAVLVDYGGSGFLSLNDHTHAEGHQGLILGWYKSAHKTAASCDFYPIINIGVQIYIHGAPAEPTFYEQQFVPEEATVYTTLSFRYGLKIKISSFFTYDTGVWCERVEVLEKKSEEDFTLAFRTMLPWYPLRIGGNVLKSETVFTERGNNGINIAYTHKEFRGKGTLVANRPFDTYKSGEFAGANYLEGVYNTPLKVGDVYSRCSVLLGDNENHISYEPLIALAERGYDVNFAEHKAFWAEYFATSSLETSDEKVNHTYKLSRYLNKAHQHPDSGVVTLGMQPNHWTGAICCSWDEEFSHEAFLTTGNIKESLHFTEQYYRQAQVGYEVMKKCGYPGIGFTGWTTLVGEFCGHTSIDEWLTDFKPMFSAYAINSIYNQWHYDKSFDSEKYKSITTDVLKFWLHRMVYKADDGLYYLKKIKDGGEMGVDADVDTFTQILFGKAFSYVGEMYNIEEYSDIGKKMLLALEGNRLPDGNMALFRGSKDNAEILINYYYIYDDGIISPEVFERQLQTAKTPFGIDNNIPTEEYRHWPWNDSFALRAHILNRRADLAAERIAHMTYGASALGVLPEKIRLDGFPVGYYYTSPHGLFVSSLCESFAVMRGKDTLLLAYGFTKETATASCQDICTAGGIKVSMTLKEGRLGSLSIENTSDKEVEIKLDLNPEIEGNVPAYLTISSCGTYRL